MKTVITAAVTVLFLSLTLSAHPALAVTIHVPADYSTIQGAIDSAADGDIVLVAPGIYVENLDFLGKAITVQSREGAGLTIIDGGLTESVVTFASGETEEASIDGLTLRNGSAQNGGGIHCDAASPTIVNCTITNNAAAGYAGGIRCNAGASPMIMNCTITGNDSYFGGGIDCFGSSSPTIVNCTISENNAFIGGGIYCCSNASPTIVNCTISLNGAILGGGIYCVLKASPEVTNCLILGNAATFGGGLHCDNAFPTVTNCTFSGNWAGVGGGIFGEFNKGGTSDRSEALTVMNCILWGDFAEDGPEIQVYVGTPVVMYSDVQGGWPGEGNMDSSPHFVGIKDFRLQAGSPCIDAGNSLHTYDDTCYPPSLGDERNDMGAFGGPGACAWCGDHDGDGYDNRACGGDDCDDIDPDTYPGAVELCDGKDNDCEGAVSDDEADEDGDGWRICEDDCDDSAWETYPGADEICDGEDNDCDGTLPEDEVDEDEDGWPLCNDCDDTNPAVSPGTEEICYNGIDDDCDGLLDLDDPECEFTLELDAYHEASHLYLDFTLGTPVLAVWTSSVISLIPSVQIIPLWTATLPIITPAIDIPIDFLFPWFGGFWVYSGIFTLQGTQAYDLVWVFAGGNG